MTQASPEQLSLDRPITTAGQLLVEGRVPEMFFREMVIACDCKRLIETRTFGDVSKDNLQIYLEIFTQKAAFKEEVTRLGIIRDAERSTADSAFLSVQHALRDADLPVPSQIGRIEGAPLAVGVFILPNCQDSGMLEDLCMEGIAETEQTATPALLPCVEQFFACLSQRNQTPVNRAKAQFAGYALARDVIDPQLGRAAQKGVIPWHADSFVRLKEFIRSVAGHL